jgi:hypothetical protein
MHWEATQRVMVAKVTRLTHKIAIQLQLVAESCTIWSFCSRQPIWKLLNTLSYYRTFITDLVTIITYYKNCGDLGFPWKYFCYFSLVLLLFKFDWQAISTNDRFFNWYKWDLIETVKTFNVRNNSLLFFDFIVLIIQILSLRCQ